jgi:succinyl-CoA synthetase beta subunit
VDLYEHQGKELFARAGVPVAAGRVAHTVDEARAAAKAMHYPPRGVRGIAKFPRGAAYGVHFDE